jgi:hypothetical protein
MCTYISVTIQSRICPRVLKVKSPSKREVRSARNVTRIWRDLGSALPFQTRHTQTKPVLAPPNEYGSQEKDQDRWQCCHTKPKQFPYRPTRNVSLRSGHVNIYSISCAETKILVVNVS